MKDNVSDVEQRVKRYWYADGFGELVGGGGMCRSWRCIFQLNNILATTC